VPVQLRFDTGLAGDERHSLGSAFMPMVFFVRVAPELMGLTNHLPFGPSLSASLACSH
jgi:hypothetical protein